MNSLRTVVLAGAVLVLVLGIAAPGRAEDKKEAETRLKAKMQCTMLPTVQLYGASMAEVVEYLRLKSKELDTLEPDPAKKGVNIILQTDKKTEDARINIDLRKVPLAVALRYAAELAGMHSKLEAGAVLVQPGTVAWVEPPLVPGVEFHPARRMREIIFPTVQCSGASVEEALEYLRLKSQGVDTEVTGPAKDGVNVILMSSREGSASPNQINLDLHDVSMAEALRSVTEQAGLQYKVEAYAVVVYDAMEQKDAAGNSPAPKAEK